MLTAKENMREVVRGGNPDRFVNQYEAIALLFHPYMLTQPLLQMSPALSRYIPPIRSW